MINQEFGQTSDGRVVRCIELANDRMTASVLTYGAILQDLRFDAAPMVLGYETFETYEANPTYAGTTVGRFANRLAFGKTTLEGRPIVADTNAAGGHLLHGGANGASVMHWDIAEQSTTHVVLGVTMPDGHMGFPGNLDVRVCYALLDDATLEVTINATTDATTFCSFAHHSYFNLGGGADILDHRLVVQADDYLPTDDFGIPSGEIRDVSGSGFDLRDGPLLSKDHPIDHNYCLAKARRDLTYVGALFTDSIRMDIETTEPGLQVYTGHGLSAGFEPFGGVAIEPQIWPDGPNHKGFPSAILKPDETYRQVSRFKFSLENP